jgi:hypothetical protein
MQYACSAKGSGRILTAQRVTRPRSGEAETQVWTASRVTLPQSGETPKQVFTASRITLALSGETPKQVLAASHVTLANLAWNWTMFFGVTFVKLAYLWEYYGILYTLLAQMLLIVSHFQASLNISQGRGWRWVAQSCRALSILTVISIL